MVKIKVINYTSTNKNINPATRDKIHHRNNKQIKFLMLKRKLGLYKNLYFLEKRIKFRLNFIINFIKYGNNSFKKTGPQKKPKILFAKKFNKLFFRAGRRILLKHINIKKNLIQKYVSKKINNTVKKININLLQKTNSYLVLLKCGVFYTNRDATNFIKNYGIFINNKINYDPQQNIKKNDTFSIIAIKYLSRYTKKKKKDILYNLSKIKLYKFRAKVHLTKRKNEWVPLASWFLENSYLYISKYSDIEFDVKTLTGIRLYNHNTHLNKKSIEESNISFFMSRSYSWHYIT